MTRVIVITSGKGGVGKTTCCANLGRALAERKKKTLLIEGDIGLNNLDATLCVEDGILYDISEYAAGKATLRQCLMNVGDDLWLLPATASTSALTAAFFSDAVNKIKGEFEYLLIDSPAGLEEGFHRAVSCAQEALIVATPHITCLRDGYKTARVLDGYGIKKIGLIVNRVREDWVMKKEIISPGQASEIIGKPLYGTIPEDDEINLGELVRLSGGQTSSPGFKHLAAFLDGEEKKAYDCTERRNCLKLKLMRWLG